MKKLLIMMAVIVGIQSLASGFLIAKLENANLRATTQLNEIEDSEKIIEIKEAEEVKEEVKEEEKKKEKINYEVKEVQDVSLGPTKRYAYRIAIEGECTKKDLENIKIEILNKAKKETPFNALSVVFYAKGSNWNGLPDYGICDYSPFGEWEKASDVKTGEYKEFKWDDNYKI